MFAEELQVFTNQQIYTTQHPLLVYGTGPENAPLVIRLFSPDGGIVERITFSLIMARRVLRAVARRSTKGNGTAATE